MTRFAPALLALTLALGGGVPPAAAQQYWIRPGLDGGNNPYNPNRTLTDTMNEHMLQNHATMQRLQRQRGGGAASAPQSAAAPGRATQDPSFRIANGRGVAIQEIYVSSAQDQSWGPDRLGQNVLPGGQRLVIRLPSGQCVNDIRVVFADGQASERRAVDTCALTDMSFP
ncbi:hypothetical protein LPC08_23980 [Roseomonas sp. OT10]|uniref:hypothetical protein n=1 Tax=Roseomonas cutis TaxID=2897332 RepID=UPI001E37B0EF|nr:hypothetical protein [Roseomonas sp. OT10]UFN49017.1 hypothetical protein LPC08_23980 [Roseomonas sp. OT10]